MNHIEKIILHQKTCLRINLEEFLSQKNATEICDAWKNITREKGLQKFIIILNAQKLNDYEPMARITFQKTINELKDSIEKVFVIAGSKVIASGAALVGIFSAHSIQVVDSESKIIF